MGPTKHLLQNLHTKYFTVIKLSFDFIDTDIVTWIFEINTSILM